MPVMKVSCPTIVESSAKSSSPNKRGVVHALRSRFRDMAAQKTFGKTADRNGASVPI